MGVGESEKQPNLEATRSGFQPSVNCLLAFLSWALPQPLYLSFHIYKFGVINAYPQEETWGANESGENFRIKVPFKCKIILYFPIQTKKCRVKLCDGKQAKQSIKKNKKGEWKETDNMSTIIVCDAGIRNDFILFWLDTDLPSDVDY